MGLRPVAECLGDAGSSLYVPGNVRTLLYSKPEAFIVKQIGHFPDVSERLMQAHLDKNDEVRPVANRMRPVNNDRLGACCSALPCKVWEEEPASLGSCFTSMRCAVRYQPATCTLQTEVVHLTFLRHCVADICDGDGGLDNAKHVFWEVGIPFRACCQAVSEPRQVGGG